METRKNDLKGLQGKVPRGKISEQSKTNILRLYAKEVAIIVSDSYTDYYNYCVLNAASSFYPFEPGYRSTVRCLIYDITTLNFIAQAEIKGTNRQYIWWSGSTGFLIQEDQRRDVRYYINQFKKAEILLLSPDDNASFWETEFRDSPRVCIIRISTLKLPTQ